MTAVAVVALFFGVTVGIGLARAWEDMRNTPSDYWPATDEAITLSQESCDEYRQDRAARLRAVVLDEIAARRQRSTR